MVLPGWLMIWILRRRSFSLRRLLLVPVAVAISLASIQFVSAFSWFQSFYLPRHFTFTVYFVALIPIPIFGFLGALGLWIVQRHWQRVVILLSLTVFMSLLLGGVILWVDSYIKDTLEHYSWIRWYWIWFLGIYAAGGALLFVKLGQPFVLALWQCFRKCYVRYWRGSRSIPPHSAIRSKPFSTIAIRSICSHRLPPEASKPSTDVCRGDRTAQKRTAPLTPLLRSTSRAKSPRPM